MKEEVLQTLNIDKEALAEKYLGLPTALGRSTSEAFEFMPNRVRGLIGTWSGREASSAGREVLLKSVAQAVPTYSMSCFLLSKITCKKIKTPISNYWWGGSADSKKIHWQSWERLTYPKALGGMGFRDLRNFNKAMLGKQGWRLMTNPESLCARVLKGRYYHDGQFLTSTRKKHSSHTWRAILAGREVLSQGLIKRVGDGNSIDIWNDRWIPHHFGGKPLTPRDGQPAVLVADLISPSGHWREDFIWQHFIPVDANAILSIPVRPQYEDIWAWEPEKYGVYSVRSAYRLLDAARIRDAEDDAAGGSEDVAWKKIWSLKVPPKVKVFWWRVLHEFLPARQILHRRHLEPIPNCEVCGAEEETIRHVLVECTVARQFWDQIKALTCTKIPRLHHATWARDVLWGNVCSEEERATIIIGMYSLWMQRNSRKHGEQDKPIKVAVKWTVDTAFDLWQLLHPHVTAAVTGDELHWERPPTGWMKCNSDGAFYENQSKGATGAVIRDEAGGFVRAGAQWYDHGLDALTMEALACRDGLVLAQQAGALKIWLESDCQELVHLWKAGDNQRSHVATLLREIRGLSLGFQDFKFSFISRKCNRVAHVLAKQVTGDARVGWWQECPDCIVNLLSADCSPDSS
jgi:ribonuclease HI